MESVLIGTPIRDLKEYGIVQWLTAVSQLEWDNYLLYMVDNSDDESFMERVIKYCEDIGFKNYELIHLPQMGGRDPEASHRRALQSEITHRHRSRCSLPW